MWKLIKYDWKVNSFIQYPSFQIGEIEMLCHTIYAVDQITHHNISISVSCKVHNYLYGKI